MKPKIEFVVQFNLPPNVYWEDDFPFDRLEEAVDYRREQVKENRRIGGRYKFRIVERHTKERIVK